MKRGIVLLILLVASTLSYVQAAKADYFVGKWNVEIKGTPGGDSKLVVTLVRKEGKLTGTVYSEADGTKDVKEVEEDGNSLKVFFKHGWFTVELLMNKKDENHCSAKMADRYDGACARNLADSE
ncbi:hypothetical protein [Labilibaculum manganireducens]|uniref:Uncharacterized protein n=1 Tax=Labilibaculum manganireducens TaxID=1940525 RepID=A0A2N3I6Q1_9BACT|nr:hypothetical protein [Labilibaculum manganireducens]PKQ66004.1 hypothetical protein BZG01_12655 [Labilibaculum manganireducens]